MKFFSLKIFFALSVLLIVFAAFPSDTSAASIVQRPPNNLGLVAYWSFNDATSTTAGDASGNRYTGTLSGGPTWVAGKLSKALSFDGNDDIVSTNGNMIGTDTVTVCAWINPTTMGEGSFGKVISTFQFSIFLTSFSGTNFAVSSDGDITAAVSGDDIVLGRWQHICAVRNSSGLATLYVNGVQSGTANQNSGTPAAGVNVAIGARTDGGSTFDGKIDEVRIYNRALTVTEIARIYRSGATIVNVTSPNFVTNGLIAYWTFDGPTVNWVTNRISDMSGNGYNATTTNMSTTTSPIAGKIGQALLFDKNDDQVSISSDIIGTATTTVCAWIYPFSSGEAGLGSIVSNDKFEVFLTNFAGDPLLVLSSDNAVTGPDSGFGAIFYYNWLHTCVVRKGDTQGSGTFYVNGVQKGAADQNTGVPIAGNNLKIGGWANGTATFDGKIDEVRIYNRVLSLTEIKQLYSMGRNR